jgi:RAB protein geranylgeranyltransferase component A
VELLIASNVAAYVDFKAVDASFLCQSEAEGLQRVPVSRSDVFVSELIAVTEKRQLMRLLQSVAPNSKLTLEQEERNRKDLQSQSTAQLLTTPLSAAPLCSVSPYAAPLPLLPAVSVG